MSSSWTLTDLIILNSGLKVSTHYNPVSTLSFEKCLKSFHWSDELRIAAYSVNTLNTHKWFCYHRNRGLIQQSPPFWWWQNLSAKKDIRKHNERYSSLSPPFFCNFCMVSFFLPLFVNSSKRLTNYNSRSNKFRGLNT